jgi:hypothetical protein
MLGSRNQHEIRHSCFRQRNQLNRVVGEITKCKTCTGACIQFSWLVLNELQIMLYAFNLVSLIQQVRIITMQNSNFHLQKSMS